MTFLVRYGSYVYQLLLAPPFLDNEKLDKGLIVEYNEHNDPGRKVNFVPTNSLVRYDPDWRTKWTNKSNTPTGANLYIEVSSEDQLVDRYNELIQADNQRQIALSKNADEEEPITPPIETDEEGTPVRTFHPADENKDFEIQKFEKMKWETANPGRKVRKGKYTPDNWPE